MIGDSGETPNPLNPSPNMGGGADSIPLDANPSDPVQPVQQPVEQSVEPVQPVITEPAVQPTQPVQPVQSVRPVVQGRPVVRRLVQTPVQNDPIVEATETIEDFRTLEEVTPVQGPAPHPMPEPVSRPAKKASGTESPKKKKKTGLFIAMVACLFVAVGCAVAAILIFANIGKVDPVKAAVNKLVNGPIPSYVIANGSIDITVNDEDSAVSKLKIDLDSAIIVNSMMNSTTATLTATLDEIGDITAKLTEVYAANGDVYIRVDGILDALENIQTALTPESIDADQTADLQNAMLTSLSSIAETIDGGWIHLSADELSSTLDSTEVSGDTQCLVSLASDLRQNRNMLAKAYNDNPFISSTGTASPIVSQNNPIYQLAFDNTKMGDFINAINTTGIIEDLNKCIQSEGDISDINTSLEELTTKLDSLPAMYIEVDENYDITRFYTAISTDALGAVVDLSFTYPQDINIIEPDEYTDLADLLQQIFAADETQTTDEGL